MYNIDIWICYLEIRKMKLCFNVIFNKEKITKRRIVES